MKLFTRYIKQRWRIISTAVIFFLIFFVSFFLYHLPMRAVLYPASLCVLLGTGLLIGDFRRVKRRHDQLEKIHTMVDIITSHFPPVEGIADADYQRIIELSRQEYTAYLSHAQQRYADMIGYYTVWAHQIKTPIASMRLHLQNEDTPLSRKLAADLLRIEQYVEMVLTFLRLDADSTDYVIKAHDLDTIIRQAIKKFAGEFIDRRLRLDYVPVNATIITDEKWLSFVIEQVLSNALKYTPAGSIRITLEPENKLCIRDTGIGIAADDLPRIFENGFTGCNGRLDKKASGIGLYLCKRICANLGHTITATSQVDKGTCITIDLNQRHLQVE